MRSIFYYAVFYPAIDLLAALAIAIILLYGGGQVLLGAATIGTVVAFIQYSERFWRPISDLSEKFNILQAAMASSERIFALLDTPPQVVAPASPRHLGGLAGRVAFEHVSFAYDRDDWVLEDIDFVVEPGRSIALVGATGVGQDDDIEPPVALLRREPRRGHPRRHRRAGPRPGAAARVAGRWSSRTSTSSRAPSRRTSASARGSPTSRRRPPPGRCTPTASSRPFPAATTPR